MLSDIEKTASAQTVAKLKETLDGFTDTALYAGIELKLIIVYAFKQIDETAREAVRISVAPLLVENKVIKDENVILIWCVVAAGGYIAGHIARIW